MSDGTPAPDPGAAGSGQPSRYASGQSTEWRSRPEVGPSAQPESGGGLAIASLVIGIAALLVCFVSGASNWAFLLGPVALGLGIGGFVRAGENQLKRWLAVAGAVIAVVALVVLIVTKAS